jgi:hypothetical protein
MQAQQQQHAAHAQHAQAQQAQAQAQQQHAAYAHAHALNQHYAAAPLSTPAYSNGCPVVLTSTLNPPPHLAAPPVHHGSDDDTAYAVASHAADAAQPPQPQPQPQSQPQPAREACETPRARAVGCGETQTPVKAAELSELTLRLLVPAAHEC